jgi:hypothetical protein
MPRRRKQSEAQSHPQRQQQKRRQARVKRCVCVWCCHCLYSLTLSIPIQFTNALLDPFGLFLLFVLTLSALVLCRQLNAEGQMELWATSTFADIIFFDFLIFRVLQPVVWFLLCVHGCVHVCGCVYALGAYLCKHTLTVIRTQAVG